MSTFKTFFSAAILAVMATSANAQCDHTADLVDTFGDGWDGAFMSVLVNSVVVVPVAEVPGGMSAASFPFMADTGDTIDTVYMSGSFENEHLYSILGGAGQVLGSDGPFPGPGISVVGDCVLPPCDHTLSLVDTFGDGWDGAFIDVNVNAANVIAGATVVSTGDDFLFPAATGDTIDTVYTSGSFENEHLYSILDGSGNVLGGDGPFPGPGISVTGDCSSPVPPPANDDCANSTTVGTGTFAFDLATATTDGVDLDPAVCDMGPFGSEQIFNDIWYCFTAPATTDYDVTTFGLAGFDTRLAVYNGCGGADPADVVACNDDFDGNSPFEAGLNFSAICGVSYKIRLGGFDAGTTGAGDLLIAEGTPPTAPANDDGATPSVINVGLTAFDTTLATTDGLTLDPAVCDMGTFGTEDIFNDVWYCFTAPGDKDYHVTTLGLAGFDTRLAVYDNNCGPDDPALVIACNDDEVQPIQSPFEAGLTFFGTAGVSYKIRLGGFGTGDNGCGELLIEEIPNVESLCYGDGTGEVCPCGNDDTLNPGTGGCLNSAGTGAVLSSNGDTSSANNTLQFDVTGAASSTFGVLVSGDNALNGGLGSNGLLGLIPKDGLRCVGGNALRHGNRALNASGASTDSWGSLTGPPGGIIGGGGFSVGQTRFFQVRYREAGGPCGSDQNTTQAIRITFKP